MGKADKKHARGLACPPIQKRHKPPKQYKLNELKAPKVTLKTAARHRLERIRNSILQHQRPFAGEIRTELQEAWANDDDRLRDIMVDLNANRAVAYWVDGSEGGGNNRKGFIGAGTGQHEYTCTYKLGRWTGNSADAEVFGIAAALGRARKSVEKGKEYKLVRIYSDAVHLLKNLRDGRLYTLGPLLAKKTALQALFERAEWLEGKGVKVELIWVKGHRNSRANKLADQTASKAVHEGSTEPRGKSMDRRWMLRADIPTWCSETGPDLEDEWLSRANRDFKFPPGFLNTHPHPDAQDDVRDDLEAMSLDRESSEFMDEAVQVRPPPMFILRWKKPEDPVPEHTFRDLWGTNSEGIGENVEGRDNNTGPVEVHKNKPYDPTSDHAGLIRMEAAVEERGVPSENLGGEGMIIPQGIGNNALDEAYYKRRRELAERESLRRIEIRRIKRERDVRKHALAAAKHASAYPISKFDGVDRTQAAIGERDVGLEDVRPEDVMALLPMPDPKDIISSVESRYPLRSSVANLNNGHIQQPLFQTPASNQPSNVNSENILPSGGSRYSLRSCIAHPDNGPIQQPLIHAPASNQPIDRSVADLRQDIQDSESDISKIREQFGESGKKGRSSLCHELQDLNRKLVNLRDELWTKTKEKPGVRDAFEDESVAAQGSRNNPYTVESSPEPEAKKPGTRDDPFVIESSPEPESRDEGEVRWVSDDLTDALELEDQLLREGWYDDGSAEADGAVGEMREEIEEDIDERLEVERQIRAEFEAA